VKKIFFIFAALIVFNELSAQEEFIKFEQFNLNDGLESNAIMDIAQDRLGYLWLASGDGLLRYDGYNFKRYKNEGDSNSLSDNSIFKVEVDLTGNIWIGSNSGIDIFNPVTNKFRQLRHNEQDSNSLSGNRILDILCDRNGHVWISTYYGVNRYDPKTKTFKHYFSDSTDVNSLTHNIIISIFQDSYGILWFGGLLGLNKYNPETDNFTRYAYDENNKYSLSDEHVFRIAEDKNSNLWLSTTDDDYFFRDAIFNINIFDKETNKFYNIKNEPDKFKDFPQEGGINSLLLDKNGFMWLSSPWEGIYRYNENTNTIKHYTKNLYDANSLSSDLVHVLFEDRSGNIWVGTGIGGLVKVRFSPNQHFKHIRKKAGQDNTLPYESMAGIYEDLEGNIWYGTFAYGLIKYDTETKKYEQFRAGEPNSISADWIWDLNEDSNGNFWIATSNGLDLYDKKANNFTNFSKFDYIFDTDRFFHQIFEDKDNNLWFATRAGLIFYDQENDSVKVFQNDTNNANSICGNNIWSIAEDKENNLWIGTMSGLSKFIRKENKFINFKNDPKNLNSLCNNEIFTLHIDNDNTLWIGTRNGLNKMLNEDKNEFKRYYSRDGLSNSMIHGILEDDNNNLWISTNNGFNKLNYKDNTIKKYDVKDGIQSLEFNSFSYHKGRSGKFYFGGTNGVTEFYPDLIIENKKEPPLVITDIKVNNQTFKSDTSASYLKTLELSHDQNIVSFTYAALDYTIPNKINYAYMMEGIDDDWIYVGNERKADYTNLDPGEYVFRVKGSNNDGVWNEAGSSINVIINPPFWATWWAYGIYFILFIGLLFLIREFEIRRQRNKTKLRESLLRTQVAESESRATKAEIEKKNHELEEARKLQLSMLPKSIPEIPGLEIAVYMKTATEVGGDYYDFDVGEDKNSLTIAVGDATGHGLKAGTMVSLIKGLFSANASKVDIKPFYEKCTQTIKQMKLGNLYMALTLLKIKNHSLIASSAGMPPMYVYKSKAKKIEEISLKGMPLGAFDDFPYQEKQIDLESGDTILILTDGLPELFNDHKEIFDYGSIESLFNEVTGKSPKEIINHLVEAGDKWANGNPQKDDMTFLVIKVK